MGELKGQILGLLLVIILFGAVGVVIKGLFEDTASDMSWHFQDTVTEITSPLVIGE